MIGPEDTNVFRYIGRAIWRPIMVLSVGGFVLTEMQTSIIIVAVAVLGAWILGTVIGDAIGLGVTAAVGGRR
jgi:hypothetical protein